MGQPTKLARTVYLADPDSGEPLVLEEGSRPPARLAKHILNPAAWSDEDVEPDGRGSVEQSGPYVGLSFGQLSAIAGGRGLQVQPEATTDEVLELVAQDDVVRAEALAKLAEYEAAKDQGGGGPASAADTPKGTTRK